jgi:hypothetical protein
MFQWRQPLSVLLAAALLAACQRTAAPPTAPAPVAAPAVATTPARAVRILTRHLRDNDLEAFARDAVPPALHRQLEAAWAQGRTRWPLQELPFANRLPALLASLSAPDAPVRLQQGFAQQFAGQDRQIHGAVASLGVFGTQYIHDRGNFSSDERAHYVQLMQAMAAWGGQAPLGDPARARQAIARLTVAARATGLASADDFRAAGMAASLQRMGRFQAAFKQALLAYGLDLDGDLDSMDASLQQQTGDSARVRMRYRLAGHPIDAIVTARRIDGRWYVEDFLRHAQASVAAPAVAATP